MWPASLIALSMTVSLYLALHTHAGDNELDHRMRLPLIVSNSMENTAPHSTRRPAPTARPTP